MKLAVTFLGCLFLSLSSLADTGSEKLVASCGLLKGQKQVLKTIPLDPPYTVGQLVLEDLQVDVSIDRNIVALTVLEKSTGLTIDVSGNDHVEFLVARKNKKEIGGRCTLLAD